MKLSEVIERLGRTVFEAPFGAASQVMGDSPEVAEIRIAVLDEVKKKIQRAGGHALFPYNVVRIVIRRSWATLHWPGSNTRPRQPGRPIVRNHFPS